ncbi:PQQ-dependent catabolism-associated beta-propeller protein [Luteitalea pratensis]|uniref:PQQ-dependent catabolism-associated beta-propeller protein n=1 Tax=Luteitalea pratensis TaxID=1855912 RepID=A0A143PLV4_LUTPR|nr:phosphoesterase [Luteitalea pratensis]AMY08759.1 PQQ-dependent catabolism-associated beta-propeller protein [Luteitalea pratensis]
MTGRLRRLLPPALVIVLAGLGLWLVVSPAGVTRPTILEPPGRNQQASITGTEATLVNGRRVTPAGTVLRTQSYNWGLAISPDQSRAALLRADSIEVVDLLPPHDIRRYPPRGTKVPALGTGTYMGIAFAPDGKSIFYGNANEGQILRLDLASGEIVATIDIDDGGIEDSFVGDFVLTRDGRTLVAVDQFNFRLVTVDVASGQVRQSVRVGRHPFAVALSPDERTAWVSNVGMFEYPLIPGVTPDNRATAGITFPAYGVPSAEAEQGTVAEGQSIPGLGPLNHPDAMSVFKVDLASGQVTQKIHTGYLVGADRDDIRTVGGASPGALAVARDRVYVSNATNDTITVLDAGTGKRLADIALNVPGLETLRGVLPFSVVLSPDQSRLYVACAGLNAVAVIDVHTRAIEGYVPAGWFAALVAVSVDGQRLYVSSAKGLGSGRNAGPGFDDPGRGLHPGDIMQGTLQIVETPRGTTLSDGTRQVIDNTYAAREVPPLLARTLPYANSRFEGPIKHIVFVVKENRTYDQVFGQRRDARGNPSGATLGLGVRVASKDGRRVLPRVDVTPNHHALADRFAISDNFYCDADQSNTGHRWVVGVYPNEWVEVNARSRIEARPFGPAPGRRNVNGSSAVVNPEDYNEAGALWEHLARHGVPFFNFGFGAEMPQSIEAQMHKETGIRMTVSFPLPKPLFDRSSRKYPTFNMAIPDQYRMDMFEEELRTRWESGVESFPSLVTIVLPNDHMTSEHPEDGYPFRESYVADNDLALGRLVERLSHSRWWDDMLIIVTEDDPQGGTDSVDAHRSLLMLISPWVKRGYVSPVLASFGSLMRLQFTLLGLPPLNQFDGAATLIDDVFSDSPDITPYDARPSDLRLFDPQLAFKPFARRFNWRGLATSRAMDDPDDMRRDLDDD